MCDGTTNDYLLDRPSCGGSTFTATLDWFRNRQTVSTVSFQDSSFDNLDLELWSTAAGSPHALISESKSHYNNVEHFSFAIPTTGEYMLRVRLTGEIFDLQSQANADAYGLAWAGVAVPEPTAMTLLLAVWGLSLLRRSRRSASGGTYRPAI